MSAIECDFNLDAMCKHNLCTIICEYAPNVSPLFAKGSQSQYALPFSKEINLLQARNRVARSGILPSHAAEGRGHGDMEIGVVLTWHGQHNILMSIV